MSNGLFRLRVTYKKQGRLAYLSHLELIRALERSIRRAELPYAITQGFHPHMKVAFGPALPVGCGGTGEFLDVWLTRFVEPGEVLATLTAASPEDLAPTEVAYVNSAEKSLTAALTRASYEATLELGEAYEGDFVKDISSIFAGELSTGQLIVIGKKKERTFELSKELWEKPRVIATEGGALVTFGSRITNEGSVRPDVYLARAQELFEAQFGSPLTVRSLTRTALYPDL